MLSISSQMNPYFYLCDAVSSSPLRLYFLTRILDYICSGPKFSKILDETSR